MNLKGIAVVKTRMWLGGTLLALAGCAAQKSDDMAEAPHDTAATTQWTSDDGSFDIIAFIEGDDVVLEPVAMEAPPADTSGSDGTVLPVPAEEEVAASRQATGAEADAGTTDVAASPAEAPAETTAAPEPVVAAAESDTGAAADNAADTSAAPAPAAAAAQPETAAAGAETVQSPEPPSPEEASPAVAAAEPEPQDAAEDEAVQEPVAVRIEPQPETDRTETIVIGDDLVVRVAPPTTPPARSNGKVPSAVPTVTLANCQSAPVPADVIASIESRLRKAGFTVAGTSDGDYLVVCGRIPPRTMWGRSMPQAGGPPLSFVRASSLAEPLGVSLKRPGGGVWQAIVEVAFDPDDNTATRRLHLREIQTIYSGDPRQVRRRDTQQLSRLDDALDAWAAAYGAANGR